MTKITHDPIRHLKSLSQTLSQDKKPIGFFISAGCPLAVETVRAEDRPLIPDMKRLTKHVADELGSGDHTNPNEFDILISELKKTEKDSSNIEEILSFIRALKNVVHGGEVRGFDEDALKKLESDICNCIVKKIRVDLPSKDTPYHKLAKWISSIDRDKAVEIFTTNYDLLMEQALEDTSVPYFDGFVGARQSFFDLRSVEDNLIPKHWARLWKIHGSINWFQKENKEVFRSDAYKNEATDVSYLIYPSHLKYDQSRKMPFLALSDQLSRFLKQPSSALIMCGYSFNDEHINDTIINALKSNPTAIVIALMFGKMTSKDATTQEINENYPTAVNIASKRHNLSLWAFDEAIIGTNPGKWDHSSNSSDMKEFDSFINKETDAVTGETSISVQLGNFKIFSNFISSLIGYSEGEVYGK